MTARGETRRLWNALAEAHGRRSLRLERRREAAERAEAVTPEPVGLTYQSEPRVAGLWAIPGDDPSPAPAMLYLFGGGFQTSSPHARRKLAGRLALAAGGSVLVAGYRLAPEHPFPAAIEDVVRACRWLLGQGDSARRLVIGGDGSGGGLALAATLLLRDRAEALPAGVVALSPWADLTCSGASFGDRQAFDLCHTRSGLLGMAAAYLGGADALAPLASPRFADLRGLPPLLLVVGGDEVLLDDALALARGAACHAVDATLVIGAGMQHAYPMYAGALLEADAAVALIGAWIRKRTGRVEVAPAGDRAGTGGV